MAQTIWKDISFSKDGFRSSFEDIHRAPGIPHYWELFIICHSLGLESELSHALPEFPNMWKDNDQDTLTAIPNICGIDNTPRISLVNVPSLSTISVKFQRTTWSQCFSNLLSDNSPLNPDSLCLSLQVLTSLSFLF